MINNWHRPSLNNDLRINWSKDKDNYLIEYSQPIDRAITKDLLASKAFRDFERELSAIGYDFSTLNISIRKKEGCS